MDKSTFKLIKIAAWGGIIVSTTGFYLQFKLIDQVRQFDYYKEALKSIRRHPGAVHFLGEPIKDKAFKISDTANNLWNDKQAHFCVPVVGKNDKGNYYFWAEKSNEKWSIIKAELELKSKPNEKLVIVKGQ